MCTQINTHKKKGEKEMTIIDNQMVEEMAIEEAKKQLQCKHVFETRHVELLDEDVEICKKCDINKRTVLLMQSIWCFEHYYWYRLKCWECPLSIHCKIQKGKK